MQPPSPTSTIPPAPMSCFSIAGPPVFSSSCIRRRAAALLFLGRAARASSLLASPAPLHRASPRVPAATCVISSPELRAHAAAPPRRGPPAPRRLPDRQPPAPLRLGPCAATRAAPLCCRCGFSSTPWPPHAVPTDPDCPSAPPPPRSSPQHRRGRRRPSDRRRQAMTKPPLVPSCLPSVCLYKCLKECLCFSTGGPSSPWHLPDLGNHSAPPPSSPSPATSAPEPPLSIPCSAPSLPLCFLSCFHDRFQICTK